MGRDSEHIDNWWSGSQAKLCRSPRPEGGIGERLVGREQQGQTPQDGAMLGEFEEQQGGYG